jgi:hypothetical protein
MKKEIDVKRTKELKRYRNRYEKNKRIKKKKM